MQVIPHQKTWQFLFQPDWKKYNDIPFLSDESDDLGELSESNFDIQVTIYKLCYNVLKPKNIWCATCIYLGDGEDWVTFNESSVDKLRAEMHIYFYTDLKPIFNQLNISEDA